MLKERSLRKSGTQTSMDQSEVDIKKSMNEDPLSSFIGSPTRSHRSRYTDTQDELSYSRKREQEDSMSYRRAQRGGGDLAELIVNFKKESVKPRRSTVTTNAMEEKPEWTTWAMMLRA